MESFSRPTDKWKWQVNNTWMQGYVWIYKYITCLEDTQEICNSGLPQGLGVWNWRLTL